MQYYGTILDLENFFGPIKLHSNTFTNNALTYDSCDLAANMDTVTFAGVDNYPPYGDKTHL